MIFSLRYHYYLIVRIFTPRVLCYSLKNKWQQFIWAYISVLFRIIIIIIMILTIITCGIRYSIVFLLQLSMKVLIFSIRDISMVCSTKKAVFVYKWRSQSNKIQCPIIWMLVGMTMNLLKMLENTTNWFVNVYKTINICLKREEIRDCLVVIVVVNSWKSPFTIIIFDPRNARWLLAPNPYKVKYCINYSDCCDAPQQNVVIANAEVSFLYKKRTKKHGEKSFLLNIKKTKIN